MHIVVHLKSNRPTFCDARAEEYQHAIVLLAVEQERVAYIFCLQLVCCMVDVNRLLSPHDALLTMHHMQATKHLQVCERKGYSYSM